MSAGDEAKSVILSVEYEVDAEYLGKTKSELARIGEQIEKGMPYAFSSDEVMRLQKYTEELLSLPVRTVIYDYLRWIGPPVLILIFAFAVLRILKQQ